MKKLISLGLILGLLLSSMATAAWAAEEPTHILELNAQQSEGIYTHTALLNGEPVPEYDYTWHADPGTAHEDVKNSPAEYYTGTAPTGEDTVYIAHDIVYYPELDQSKFQLVNYDGEQEWVYPYEAEGYTQYLFSTLPALRTGFPSQMMHSAQEAYGNAVLHITQPGTYSITGTWQGQILVDLGEEDQVYSDPEQTVTLILNGVDITCTVAPGVVFASVYECDSAWEDADSYSHNVDTTGAGANVVLADGTVNNVSGTNVFRILKTKFKDEASTDAHPAQKKAWKQDGAFYSYMSMNITGQTLGTGVLNITSGFEGLNSEHHLTLNGGSVNIWSQDDGINVNEDGVSVLTVNGGSLHICAGLGSEGDGIDSNGFLVINGGTVITAANPASDSGLDSDFGSYVNGGTVVALGSTMDWAESDGTSGSTQPVLNLRFAQAQSADEAILVTDTQGKVVLAYDPDKDEVTGEDRRTYQGAILSGPGLELGGEYRIYIGGDVSGTEVSGVYDPDTVTGFTGSQLQCWSGTALGGMGGRDHRQDFGGMTPPEGAEMPEMGDGQLPEGFRPDGKAQPQGGEAPELPEGMEPPEMPEGGEMPEMPGGGQQRPGGDMGEGFDPGSMERPGGFSGGRDQPGSTGATCTLDTVFPLSNQVNAFSSVTDVRHEVETGTCTACGQTLGEAGNDPQAPSASVQSGTKAEDPSAPWLWIGLGAAVLAAAAAVTVLLCRRGKQPEDAR